MECTYFTWDEEESSFCGELTFKGKNHKFVFNYSTNYSYSLLKAEETEESMVTIEDYEIITGEADYQKGYLVLKIENDPYNIFNDEINEMKFVRHYRNENTENEWH